MNVAIHHRSNLPLRLWLSILVECHFHAYDLTATSWSAQHHLLPISARNIGCYEKILKWTRKKICRKERIWRQESFHDILRQHMMWNVKFHCMFVSISCGQQTDCLHMAYSHSSHSYRKPASTFPLESTTVRLANFPTPQNSVVSLPLILCESHWVDFLWNIEVRMWPIPAPSVLPDLILEGHTGGVLHRAGWLWRDAAHSSAQVVDY